MEVALGLSSFAFIVGLVWSLGRQKPAVDELPAFDIFSGERPGYWVRTILIFVGLALTFFIGMMVGTGFSLMLVCGLIGFGVTIAWRGQLTGRIAGLALAAGIISALGIAFLGNGDLSWAIANLITLPPAFSGGVLLLQRTQLGKVRLVEGEIGLALKGFAMGCLLAVPAAVLNQLGNMSGQDTWVVNWWQPLYAIVPGIAEETWARLFLMPFCYAIVRPVAGARPRRALGVAILVSLLAHGFAHTGIDPFGILIGTVLYTLPVALLLVKKDFEHAVGYHFMVDFVRFGGAFLALAA